MLTSENGYQNIRKIQENIGCALMAEKKKLKRTGIARIYKPRNVCLWP